MGEEEADDPEGKRSRQVTLERQDLKESTGASGTGARGGGLCGTAAAPGCAAPGPRLLTDSAAWMGRGRELEMA